MGPVAGIASIFSATCTTLVMEKFGCKRTYTPLVGIGALAAAKVGIPWLQELIEAGATSIPDGTQIPNGLLEITTSIMVLYHSKKLTGVEAVAAMGKITLGCMNMTGEEMLAAACVGCAAAALSREGLITKVIAKFGIMKDCKTADGERCITDNFLDENVMTLVKRLLLAALYICNPTKLFAAGIHSLAKLYMRGPGAMIHELEHSLEMGSFGLITNLITVGVGAAGQLAVPESKFFSLDVLKFMCAKIKQLFLTIPDALILFANSIVCMNDLWIELTG